MLRAGWCFDILPSVLTFSTFHISTVPSAEHEAKRSPDGANLHAYTTPLCPWKVNLLFGDDRSAPAYRCDIAYGSKSVLKDETVRSIC